ncbi:MAG: sulfur carrier protein ThiS [Candidatus Tectomicrobia bacterium]|uniref:Sulfur carrier protein ThiS n=1 Tax=Tectimicrobiota bacterium TaxID=2528274 RepID=A0A932HXV0_UNCTE|nr:sulfur carrier protein ThiS [Candidatus Tectomicrobia bacterium]
MRIRVNGEEKEVAGGLTVSALLESLDLPPTGIAVALNMEVVRRSDYAAVALSEGDEVEIVRAVGGG